nr:PREDICTED: uncharacterized protein LOC108207301 [Daucus carota subsp. sativus]
MAALRAELERLNTENARLKSGELVSLQEKVVDASISSLQKQMDEHVKGIYSMIDRIDKNHELKDPSTKGEKDKDQDKDKDGADQGGNKDGENNADGSDKGGDKGGEGASGKDSSAADKGHDKGKGKMP